MRAPSSIVTAFGAAALIAAGAVVGEELKDPYFGEALFYSHQGLHFEALERLDAELVQHHGLDEPPLDSLYPHVNEAECAGCFECLAVCPYGAIERKELLDAQGHVTREVAAPNPAMCEGCGLCTVTCRGGYIDLEGYTDEQVFAQLGALGPLREVIER